MNPILAYLKQRLGEPTSIAAVAGAVAATLAFAFGKIDYQVFSVAISGLVAAFLMPQGAMPVQGASAATSEPTPAVSVTTKPQA